MVICVSSPSEEAAVKGESEGRQNTSEARSLATIEPALRRTHLADVDQSTHQILVRERVHGILSLFARRVFHNPAMRLEGEFN